MTQHILQVEDERPLKSILATAFTISDPTITLSQATTADEAMSYIAVHGPNIDLYVLDIALPGTINGVELARQIRKLNYPGFIVLTSAYGPPPLEVLKDLHAEYYPKPWHVMELTEKLLKYRLELSPLLNKTSNSDAAASQQSAPLSTCPLCGKDYQVGQVVCFKCGAVLGGTDTRKSISLEQAAPDEVAKPKGDVIVAEDQALVLKIEGQELSLPASYEVMLGRATQAESQSTVFVDLTPFDAINKGVSRRHLKITRKKDLLYLSDLGSSNGTWLNGQRMIPNRERPLRHGDLIQMGKLQVNIQFQRQQM